MHVEEGPVVDSPADVHVETDKEEGGPVRVHGPEESAIINVPANVGDPGKGKVDVCGVVYS